MHRLVPPLLFIVLACNDPSTGPRVVRAVTIQVIAPSVGLPGLVLRDTIWAQVRDSTSQQPRVGVRLEWLVTRGAGSLLVLDSLTDSAGRARALWRLGPLAGENRLVIRSADLRADGGLSVMAGAFQADQVVGNLDMGCGLVQATLWCWGEDYWNSTEGVSDLAFFGWVPKSAPAVADSMLGFVSFALTPQSICGLDADLQLWCATSAQHNFAIVPGLPLLRRVIGAPSNVFHCGLAAADSTAWCWQVGHPPAPVPASPAFTEIRMEYVDALFACGLQADSTAMCWGAAPLGDGTLNPSATPVRVLGGLHFAELAVGERFACGLTSTQDVWCWGTDYDPNGSPSAVVPTPSQVRTGIHHLATQETLVVGFGAGNSLVAWRGAGYESLPTPSGLPTGALLASHHSSAGCLVLADHEVYCVDEMWDNSTVIRHDTYSGVQPVPPSNGPLLQ